MGLLSITLTIITNMCTIRWNWRRSDLIRKKFPISKKFLMASVLTWLYQAHSFMKIQWFNYLMIWLGWGLEQIVWTTKTNESPFTIIIKCYLTINMQGLKLIFMIYFVYNYIFIIHALLVDESIKMHEKFNYNSINNEEKTQNVSFQFQLKARFLGKDLLFMITNLFVKFRGLFV